MDADKIKNFFIFHFEKMILAVVIGVSCLLIYSGLQMPDFLKEHQPDRLATSATQVKSEIDEDHNSEIFTDDSERIPTLDILAETKKLYTPVDPSAYPLPKTFNIPSDQAIVRRQDPVLAPPKALMTHGVITTLAVRSATEKYPLDALEAADEVEKVEAPRRRTPSTRGRRGGGMDEEMMMMGMGMDMEMEMDMMGMGMGMGMDPSMGATAGANRRFDSKYDFYKFRPVATQDKKHPKPAIGWFIAGTAVLPHKEIYQAYELALRDAVGYDPTRRDTPIYFNLEVQRADVTDKPVDQLTDQDWSTVWTREDYAKIGAGYWSGFAPEIVPADYRDDALTTWIPPVLLDDYSTFALHPLIPMVPQQELLMQQGAVEEEVDDKEFDLGDSNLELLGPGMQGSGMGSGMEMDMMDMSMGMGMDMEMDMMMGGVTRGVVEKNPVQHKLIRFYDFTGFRNSPRYGRDYVYRIRYAVVDPNFPAAPTLQPKTKSLAPDVAARVMENITKAEATKKRSKDLFSRWSDWSEPSPPASLPTPEQVFVGPISPGASYNWTVAGKNIEYVRDAPTAKVVAAAFDQNVQTRVPFTMEVTEGSVLAHKAESADVVDPITLKIKKLPDAQINSGTTVVDLEGGAPLKIAEGLSEPGVMLLYDQSGQLKVTDEVGDQEFYRIYSFADERGE